MICFNFQVMEALCKDGLKGHKQSAQGIALGIQQAQPTPYRGKRIPIATMLLPFQGVPSSNASTQGDALG